MEVVGNFLIGKALELFSLCAKWIFGLIGKDLRSQKKLDLLTSGSSIRYFRKLLGEEFCTTHKGQFMEYIFKEREFFVQAVTENDKEKVVMFSVTTREKSFNPKMKLPYGEKITLGQTTFSDLGGGTVDDLRNTATSINEDWPLVGVGEISTLGANWFYRSQFSYFGGQGKYQTFVIAINESGYFKDLETINTFGVIVMGYPKALEDLLKKQKIFAGPDQYDFGILKD